MLKPIGDRLVVTLEEEKEQTVGGFVLAGAGQAQTRTAQVLAVGEGSRTLNGDVIAPAVKAGDRVVIDQHVGIEVTDGDDKVLVIREADVIAVLV